MGSDPRDADTAARSLLSRSAEMASEVIGQSVPSTLARGVVNNEPSRRHPFSEEHPRHPRRKPQRLCHLGGGDVLLLEEEHQHQACPAVQSPELIRCRRGRCPSMLESFLLGSLEHRGHGAHEVFQPTRQIHVGPPHVVVVMPTDLQSVIVGHDVARVILLQREQPAQAVPASVQEEHCQASIRAVRPLPS